jgi:pimeloyl-ACP methyl ester carboxylesterase
MVKKLVLLDAIGPLTTPSREAATKYQLYLKQLKIIKKKPKRLYQTIEEACLHRGASGYLSAELVTDIVNRGLKKTDNGFEWRHDPRLLLPSPLKMTETQALFFLQEVQAETLLINATQGFKVDEQRYQKRLDAIANLQFKTLDCGHHLHIEQPKECAKLINAFLS